MVNAAIVGLPDPCWKIQELSVCPGEPNGDCGPHACVVAQVCNNDTAAGWVKGAMEFDNPTLFASCIIANKPTADLGPRLLCVVTAGTFLRMTFSHLQLGIWSMISGEESNDDAATWHPNWKASRNRTQGSTSPNESINEGISGGNNTSKPSETILFISLPILKEGLLLVMMWLGYVGTITLWILPPLALWPIDRVQAVTQQQSSHSEDWMHWLDGHSRISVVGGYFFWHFAGWTDGWEFGVFWRGCASLFGVLYIVISHQSDSCVKGYVESSWCWDEWLRRMCLQKA